MKTKITDEIKEIISSGINWVKLELEYLKLTAAEKLIILMSTVILGAVALLLLVPLMIMLMFALADVFMMFLPPWLAYLSVGGVVLIMIVCVFVFRNALIITPCAKFITRLFLEKSHSSDTKK